MDDRFLLFKDERLTPNVDKKYHEKASKSLIYMNFRKFDLKISEFWIITEWANIFVGSKLAHRTLEKQVRSVNQLRINKNENLRRI